MVTRDLGSVWLFPAVTDFKPYPCCRIQHGALDCFFEILDAHQLVPADIREVRVFLEGFCMDRPSWRNMELTSPIDGQFSTPYIFAVAAHRVPIGPAWQDAATMRNPEIRGFMGKVGMLPHPGWAQAGVEVVLHDGRTFKGERMHPKGQGSTAASRMTDDELVHKFRVNAERGLPEERIVEVTESLQSLERVADVAKLIGHLAS